jgi:hypothetical protein
LTARGDGWSRAEFLRRAAGSAAGLAALGGAAFLVRELIDSDEVPAGEAAVGRRASVRHFQSRPDLKPPVIDILQPAPHAAGHLFLAPSSGPGQRGVLILDSRGEVVWFHPTAPKTSMNFRAAVYKGAPVLTWWEALDRRALSSGEHVIVDASYRELARFPAGGGLDSDLHEYLLTPQGTALVTSYEDRTLDLSALGGATDARVLGGIAQELEVPSAKVLFEWRSLDHVAPSESYVKIGRPFDYFHINSIEPLPDGDLLISARNTWAVYKISRDTGEVVWRLGGRRSDFAMGEGTVFAWQHDARHHGNGRISIFDNASMSRDGAPSRALMLQLDDRRRRASLVREYAHEPAVRAHAMGNAQLLPTGNLLVGWGTDPRFTEYASDGSVVFDASLPRGGQNYRALRFPWIGRPADPPELVGRTGAAGAELVVSWNGATEVASWRLETGATPAGLTALVTQPRDGFETRLYAPAQARYAAAVALDRNGAPLGTSRVVRL